MDIKELNRRHPRRGALLGFGLCAILVAVNLSVLSAVERFYPIVFPLAGAMMGPLLLQLVTGRSAVVTQPIPYRVVLVGGALVGMAGGFYANFAVTGGWL